MVILTVGLCMYDLLRRSPHNLVFLLIFTCLISVMVASVIVRFHAEIVVTALAFAALLVVILILAAAFGNFDITIWAGVLFSLLLVFILGVIVSIFWMHSIFQIALCGGGAVIFSLYLVFDIQRMMGNKTVSIQPNEYILGAITLYMDIVSLFMYLLSLITFSRCR